MIKPLQMKAKLAEKQIFNEKFTQFSFELVAPHTLEFQAGQYVSITVDEHGDRRSYSIASTPENQHGFDLLIDLSPGGVGSKFLESLEFGQEIEVLGPLGRFVLKEENGEEALVLVATGSGVAPFRSMILELLQDKGEKKPITLYWGMRYVEELFWQNDFEDLAEEFPNFHFHPVISKAAEQWPLCRGRVTDCLSMHDIPTNGGYYLCGNAKMIEEVNMLLQKRGVKKENVHFEKFF